MYRIQARPGTVLQLGYAGENGVRQIVFPMDRFWELGDGRAELMYALPGEDQLYPVTLTQAEDGAVWTITEAETSRSGYGQAQLNYLVGERTAKTEVYDTSVLSGLRGTESPTPPEPQKGWVDQVLAAGVSTEASADRAEQAAGRAADSKAAADKAVDQAAEHEKAAAEQADRAFREAEQAGIKAGQLINDKVLTYDKVMSGRRTVELLGEAFIANGPVVTCKPLENCPLEVISQINGGALGIRRASLWRKGKNLIDNATYQGKNGLTCNYDPATGDTMINGTTTERYSELTWLSGKIFAARGVYTVSIDHVLPFSLTLTVRYRSGGERSTTIRAGKTSASLEVAGNDIYFSRLAISGFTAGTDIQERVKIQVEVGEKATGFEAYRGNVYSVEFGRAVQSGQYNWTTGVLTVTAPEPAVVQLPAHAVTALEGLNSVYSDAGDVTVRGIGKTTTSLEARMLEVERMILNMRGGSV